MSERRTRWILIYAGSIIFAPILCLIGQILSPAPAFFYGLAGLLLSSTSLKLFRMERQFSGSSLLHYKLIVIPAMTFVCGLGLTVFAFWIALSR